jgi:hypothetical protein
MIVSLTSSILPQLLQVNEKDFLQSNGSFSIAFESGSTLVRIVDAAFTKNKLSTIKIPTIVHILGSSCFDYCQMLQSVTFTPTSILQEIRREVFPSSSLISRVLPICATAIRWMTFSGSSQLSTVPFSHDSRLQ